MATFTTSTISDGQGIKRKLHGREFYRSIGSPKYILAPMVDQSEFAWRMLTRSFMSPRENQSLLAYTPMFHARMFTETPKYRQTHFQPLKEALPSPPDKQHAVGVPLDQLHLDGNPSFDRPLFVQFCANEPDDFLTAAQHVAAYCDAVDLNLGCPQGIARKGRYGAFLQEDWPTIRKLICTLRDDLSVPVTAKFRIQETKERTLEYARMILDAGASVITVHGRQREQKGHNTGLADWSVIRYLRDHLPADTVIFANGNILQHEDIANCLRETGADGVMSAEANLYDPSIFARPPPVGEEGREYWRGADGKGGWRMDAALRRYLDIIHRHVLGHDPPVRKPLYTVADGDLANSSVSNANADPNGDKDADPPLTNDGTGPALTKKQQRRQKLDKGAPTQKYEKGSDPNLQAMQAHLFHMLRPLVARHTDIRDRLARARAGDIDTFEQILSMVERVVAEGIREEAASVSISDSTITEQSGAAAAAAAMVEPDKMSQSRAEEVGDQYTSSLAAVQRCRRPWFVCQPYVRPLPREALEKGALSLSKKDKEKKKKLELELELEAAAAAAAAAAGAPGEVQGRAEERVVGTDRVVQRLPDGGQEGGGGLESGSDRKRKRDGGDDGDGGGAGDDGRGKDRTVGKGNHGHGGDDGIEETVQVPRDGLVCG